MKISKAIDDMHNAHDRFQERVQVDTSSQYGSAFSPRLDAIAMFKTDREGSFIEETIAWYPAFMLATFSLNSASWMWAWANQNIPNYQVSPTVSLRELGVEKEIPEFSKQVIIMPVDIGLSFASIINSRLPAAESNKLDRETAPISRYDEEQLLALVFYHYKPKAIISYPDPSGDNGPTSFFVVTSDEAVSDYKLNR